MRGLKLFNHANRKNKRQNLLSLLVNLALGAGGLGLECRAGLITQCRQQLATAATFLRSCVVQQALSGGDGPRRSHAIVMKI